MHNLEEKVIDARKQNVLIVGSDDFRHRWYLMATKLSLSITLTNPLAQVASISYLNYTHTSNFTCAALISRFTSFYLSFPVSAPNMCPLFPS